MNSQQPAVRVGSVIRYRALANEVREVTVDYVSNDIKNGYAGFDGTMANGDGVWGYMTDVIAVVRY
jgi:hypothetical protein